MKVLLKLKSDRSGRFLCERVSGEVAPTPIPVRDLARVPCSGIFIGPKLDPDETLRLIPPRRRICGFKDLRRLAGWYRVSLPVDRRDTSAP